MTQGEEKRACEIRKEQKSTGIDVGKIENDGCKNEVDGCENGIDGCKNRVDGCGNRINVQRLQIGSHQVIITPKDVSVDAQTLQLIPRCIVAGVGCKKGTPVDKIEHAVQDAFAKTGLRMEALCAVVSIDLKKKEAGLLEFCETRNVPFKTYAAEELQAVPGTYSASEFVSGVTGVDNVCERSAVKYASEHATNQGEQLLGRQAKHGELLLRKQAYGGVTVALAYMCSE